MRKGDSPIFAETKIGTVPGGSAAVDYAPNDLSWYANIPVPTSYMCVGSHKDFFGGYDHGRQAGIVHVANHHISPGKKQWTWGNQEFGCAWDRNLTDADGPYIEIMAGVYTDNQPDFSFLQPGETKTWSQYWYPIQKIGVPCDANRDAAVRLSLKNRKARVGVSVSSVFPGATVTLTAVDGVIGRFTRDLAPGSPLVEEIDLPRQMADTDVLVRVADATGREIIATNLPSPDQPSAGARRGAGGEGRAARKQVSEPRSPIALILALSRRERGQAAKHHCLPPSRRRPRLSPAPTNCSSPACTLSNIAMPRDVRRCTGARCCGAIRRTAAATMRWGAGISAAENSTWP